MLSDTLSDAAAEMRRYLTEYPQYYTDCRSQIEELIQRMDFLRRHLDTVAATENASEACYPR